MLDGRGSRLPMPPAGVLPSSFFNLCSATPLLLGETWCVTIPLMVLGKVSGQLELMNIYRRVSSLESDAWPSTLGLATSHTPTLSTIHLSGFCNNDDSWCQNQPLLNTMCSGTGSGDRNRRNQDFNTSFCKGSIEISNGIIRCMQFQDWVPSRLLPIIHYLYYLISYLIHTHYISILWLYTVTSSTSILRLYYTTSKYYPSYDFWNINLIYWTTCVEHLVSHWVRDA